MRALQGGGREAFPGGWRTIRIGGLLIKSDLNNRPI